MWVERENGRIRGEYGDSEYAEEDSSDSESEEGTDLDTFATFDVVEMDAGSGQLGKDINDCVRTNCLRLPGTIHARFLRAWRYTILERSLALEQRQRRRGLHAVVSDAQTVGACETLRRDREGIGRGGTEGGSVKGDGDDDGDYEMGDHDDGDDDEDRDDDEDELYSDDEEDEDDYDVSEVDEDESYSKGILNKGRSKGRVAKRMKGARRLKEKKEP